MNRNTALTIAYNPHNYIAHSHFTHGNIYFCFRAVPRRYPKAPIRFPRKIVLNILIAFVGGGGGWNGTIEGCIHPLYDRIKYLCGTPLFRWQSFIFDVC